MCGRVEHGPCLAELRTGHLPSEQIGPKPDRLGSAAQRRGRGRGRGMAWAAPAWFGGLGLIRPAGYGGTEAGSQGTCRIDCTENGRAVWHERARTRRSQLQRLSECANHPPIHKRQAPPPSGPPRGPTPHSNTIRTHASTHVGARAHWSACVRKHTGPHNRNQHSERTTCSGAHTRVQTDTHALMYARTEFERAHRLGMARRKFTHATDTLGH